jgi:hypothetical protein
LPAPSVETLNRPGFPAGFDNTYFEALMVQAALWFPTSLVIGLNSAGYVETSKTGHHVVVGRRYGAQSTGL